MDDLVGEFITETTESLSVLDGELVNLERNPDDDKILGNIFRIMHTIKGTCGFLGLSRLETVAHASENVLGKIRDKKLEASPQAVSLILESLDSIKALLDDLSNNDGQEQPGDDSALVARLNQFAEGGGVAASSPAPVAETKPAAADAQFPHFKGEDEPEIAAALAALAATAAAAGKVAAPIAPAPAAPAPVAAKPAPAPKPAAKENTGEQKENAASKESIRVGLDVLENLMQTVSELVLTRNQLMQIVRTKEDKEFMTPLQQLSHITSELQDGVMKTRMQPIGNAWSKFPRLIRDLSMELGKKIDLKMLGAETELDRHLLEIIKDPLTHMVRNSCDHGLETPADRVAAGKSEVGTVTLSAYHEGGHIIIDIVDDGRGINIEKVKAKALANGLATQAALDAMSEKQIAQYIFHAGLSTAEKVTSVSGRGVGMDVVKTNIQKIGGTIDLDSSWGKGSKVSVKIPLTLAIVSVLIVEAAKQKFAVPQINVTELVRVSPGSEVKIELINNAPVIRLRGKLLPLTILAEVLGGKVDHKDLLSREMYIAVCKVGAYDFGIIVDHVYDTEEIVVKPVAEVMKSLPIYSGNTILGDGSVIMILDPNGVAKTLGNVDMASRAQEEDAAAAAARQNVEHTVGFLLFTLGKGSPKAVPLELVSRLEEVDVSTIECADDYPVVQYRGELMRLITLNDEFAIPSKGKVQVIVFSYDKKVVGLVVDEIADIVHAPFSIKLQTKEIKAHGYLGSMVILGKTTDIVDVSSLLADIIDQDLTSDAARARTDHNRILLVEDSPFFTSITVPLLTSAGYQVKTAEDGKQALDLLSRANSKFDMIVTDIEMPIMNGFEFATACRRNPQVNGIPIVAYTSSYSTEVLKRSKEAGMNDCVVKTDRPGLLQSMSRQLEQYKGAAA